MKIGILGHFEPYRTRGWRAWALPQARVFSRFKGNLRIYCLKARHQLRWKVGGERRRSPPPYFFGPNFFLREYFLLKFSG